ncbi:NAD(P)/FAD-dependent oxidoreductase [Roseomonas marmotae]|uniref:NAD(P)/FAD-dependent oxidoreductase n=1 Tax=Roseomonas marmotae TaxID=2768161 RepID=A0ABS3KH38_9PROT|nr:NAD(P)/FAD-dependent oxidoreductase [Roseomonas marmotae]MBO1076796.1 NAD(P)/FAD-dependent oxidoreductase [Roseomonas marmotae]QTI78739.1 NAD(P)/FAD-dependent oxidoreductase [Roseomonas marmotae]
MEQVDVVVVGAGVVGLAVARALALSGREVLVLEAAEGIGTGTSSRNSEVIHAGIYYPRGSLMARTCVAGKKMLYAYCEEHGVPYRNCGKLIVATNEAEAGQLASIQARAAANGVDDLRMISAGEAREMEPVVACTAALVSPSTGIIDSHSYMLALQGDAEDAGTAFAFHAPVLSGRLLPEGGAEISVGGAEPMELRCALLVNAAGLHAPALAGRLEGMPAALVPPTFYAKGNYFTLAGRSPFTRLIYPVPVPGGLGTHLTIDLGGQAKFGPDVEWVDQLDYEVNPERGASFYAAIRRYWPGLPDGALQPGYSGIRPKIVGPAQAAQDFVVQGPRDHGQAGLVNLFGIESPGLTASLALGEVVLEALGLTARG